MLNLYRAQRAAALSAMIFALGLPACLGNTHASELTAAPFETHGLAVASVDPFETPRAVPEHQLPEPFGLQASALVRGSLQHKWISAKKRLFRERKILTQCRAAAAGCPPAASKFLGIVDRALARDGWARIAEINRAINLDIRPVDDMTQYGVVDLWATPLMAFASNAGDCEDYAIAKFVALHEIGISADDLRLLIVHDRATNEDHAVAAVRYDGRWLILDNRSLDIRQDVDIAEFDPLFVIDGEGVKRMTASPSKPENTGGNISPAGIEPLSSSAWTSAPLLL